MPSGTPIKWLHGEVDPIAAFTSMQGTAASKKWGAIPRKMAEHNVRALVLASLQAARVSTSPPPAGQWPDPKFPLPEHSGLIASVYANQDDLFVGSTIARTLVMLTPTVAIPLFDITTLSDGPVEKWTTSAPGGDTAAIPVAVLVAAVVVGGTALTVAAVKLIHTAGEVIDRELSRENDTKEVVALQSGAITVSIDHAAREEKAGQSLPWNDGEKTVILSLLDAQNRMAKRQGKPLASPFDGAIDGLSSWGTKVVDTVGNGVNTVATGVASGMEMMLPAAAVAFAAFSGK